MNDNNIFFDDWLDCLREHYKDVLRRDDRITRPTLETILHEIGFGEDELRDLYLQATMRADDVAEHFVPDFESLAAPSFQPHPAECACSACAPLDERGHDADGQPLSSTASAEAADGDDTPTQLAMF